MAEFKPQDSFCPNPIIPADPMPNSVHDTGSQTAWRMSINYGPEGEANYANVYDASGYLVGNLRTHHAREIVRLSCLDADAGLRGEVERLKAALKVEQAVSEFMEGMRDRYLRERDEATARAEAAEAALAQSQGMREAARAVVGSASDTYRKRNGKIGSIEGDDGEKCWIVPFDEFEALRAALVQASAPAIMPLDGWRPIVDADCAVATVQTFGEVTLRNSHPAWVRDEDGRTYEAVWTVDDRQRGYWWDIDGESPVDPVEIYPHPLAQPVTKTDTAEEA